MITAPSSTDADPLAACKASTVYAQLSPARAAELLRPWLGMMIAKQSIHGILCGQFADSEPHRWPSGGILDAAGTPKPVAAMLADLRKQHLT